jgi:hypothetical protein
MSIYIIQLPLTIRRTAIRTKGAAGKRISHSGTSFKADNKLMIAATIQRTAFKQRPTHDPLSIIMDIRIGQINRFGLTIVPEEFPKNSRSNHGFI